MPEKVSLCVSRSLSSHRSLCNVSRSLSSHRGTGIVPLMCPCTGCERCPLPSFHPGPVLPMFPNNYALASCDIMSHGGAGSSTSIPPSATPSSLDVLERWLACFQGSSVPAACAGGAPILGDTGISEISQCGDNPSVWVSCVCARARISVSICFFKHKKQTN